MCRIIAAQKTAEKYLDMVPEEFKQYDYFFEQMAQFVFPNIKRNQNAFLDNKMKVMFTVIECLTQDGRDRGLDCKITGFNVTRGSRDAKVVRQIAPVGDEIVMPKTSSSVFNSTNIDYVLRNLNCRQLIICRVLTDQCVESAVRNACDLNYLVTLVPDACATLTEARQTASLAAIKGYCRQVPAENLIHEISRI